MREAQIQRNPRKFRTWEGFLDKSACGETQGVCPLARCMMGLSRLAPGRALKPVGPKLRSISSLSIDAESEASSRAQYIVEA